jgi:hypothetical protein
LHEKLKGLDEEMFDVEFDMWKRNLLEDLRFLCARNCGLDKAVWFGSNAPKFETIYKLVLWLVKVAFSKANLRDSFILAC